MVPLSTMSMPMGLMSEGLGANMGTRPFKIRFHYFDGRKPYTYALEPTKTADALRQFRRQVEWLKKSNENGVSRVDLKLGNRIIDRINLDTYPSRWYVVKEKDSSFFAEEGRPWGVCVPNSPRRKGNYTTEEEARRIAAERNEESKVGVYDV